MSLRTTLLIALAATIPLACTAPYEPDPRLVPATRRVDDDEHPSHPIGATRLIATARCQQETVCEHVGPGKRHADGVACVKSLQEEALRELELSECPGLVNQRSLALCLESIRSLSCNAIEKDVVLLAQCRVLELCRSD